MPKISIETILGSNQAKPIPYFEEYLSKTAQKPRSAGESFVLGCSATVVGVAAIQLVLQQIMFWPWAMVLNILFGFPVLLALVIWAVSAYRQPKTPKDKRLADIHKAGNTMRQLVAKKKLSKALGSALAPLLEESAKNWSRALASLNGPFWTNEKLPSHWQEVREKSIAAANDAMGDLVLIAACDLKPVANKSDWQDFVGSLVSSALGTPEVHSNEPIPAGFEPARTIADKLSLLANEVEKATTRVFKEQPEETPFISATSLDKTLSEFRSISEAEEELQQNIGDSGL